MQKNLLRNISYEFDLSPFPNLKKTNNKIDNCLFTIL